MTSQRIVDTLLVKTQPSQREQLGRIYTLLSVHVQLVAGIKKSGI